MKKILFIVFVLFVPLLVLAQKWSTVTGRVVDPEIQAVAGATIILARPGDNFTRQTISNDNGEYSFERIPGGKYTVQVHKKGFRVKETTFTVQTGINPAPVEMQLELEGLESEGL
jgi:hypothetical protein